MKINTNQPKINKYLDELAEEYKDLLLKRLIEDTDNIEEINISKLLRLDSEIKGPLMKKNNKAERLKKILLVTGIVYIVIGSIMSIIYDGLTNKSGLEMATKLIIGAGLLTTFLAFIMPEFLLSKGLLKKKDLSSSNDDKLLKYQIVTTWRDVESIADELDTLKNENNSSMYTPIEKLKLNDLITDKERTSLLYLLKLRNSIVHNNEITFDRNEAEKIISLTEEILRKLNKIL